jgi:hypothetical protein
MRPRHCGAPSDVIFLQHVAIATYATKSMRYLNEREVGFDPQAIGFPSISGCLAIAYVTDNGLFGFHNAGGGGDPIDTGKRAAAFADYVSKHFLGCTAGTRLYAVTYATSIDPRYGAPQMDNWTAEVTAYANALKYAGPIRGYDLGASGIAPGAYVELRKTVVKCEIWIKKWNDHDRTPGMCTTPMHHKWIKRDGGGNYAVLPIVAGIAEDVTTANLRRVHSTRLRG